MDNVDAPGSLNYAFIEHNEGVAVIANFHHLFVLGVTSSQAVKIALVIKQLEKIKRVLESEVNIDNE